MGGLLGWAALAYVLYLLARLPLALFAFSLGGAVADVLEYVLVIAFTAYALYLLIRLWFRRRYAAITPAGIQVRTLTRERLIPWSEFRQVQMFALMPAIYGEGRRAYRIYLTGIFSNRRQFNQFDEMVEAASERYRPRG